MHIAVFLFRDLVAIKSEFIDDQTLFFNLIQPEVDTHWFLIGSVADYARLNGSAADTIPPLVYIVHTSVLFICLVPFGTLKRPENFPFLSKNNKVPINLSPNT